MKFLRNTTLEFKVSIDLRIQNLPNLPKKIARDLIAQKEKYVNSVNKTNVFDLWRAIIFLLTRPKFGLTPVPPVIS